jgi:hypothetical protein
MAIKDPCEDLNLPPAIEPEANNEAVTGGQGVTPGVEVDTTEPDLGPITPPVPRPFYVQETIGPSEVVNSADRTISLINEEYYAASPIPQPGDKIRTANLIVRSKRNLSQDIEIDYFRAANLSMWNRSSPLKFINPLTSEDKDKRDLGIPFNITMGNTRVTDDSDGLNFITMFDVNLDVEWTRANTSDFKNFRNQPGVFFDVLMYGEASAYYDPILHEEYKWGLFDTNPYYCDSVFEGGLPISQKETNLLHLPGFNTANVTLSETRIVLSDDLGNSVVDELQIPSLYEMFAEKQKEDKADGVSKVNNSEPESIPSVRVHKFTSDRVEAFQDANAELEAIAANSVTISISTKQDNTIAQYLRNNKMDRHLLDLIAPINNDWPSRQRIFSQVNDETIFYKNSIVKEQTANDKFRIGIRGETWMSFEQKLKSFTSTDGPPASLKEEYPLGYYGDDRNERILKFEDAITSQLFLKDLKKYVKQNNLTRTFNQILAGQKAYSETVAYHVEKINADTQEVIQDFYFSDSTEVLEINYVDTQIISGKKYIYRINAVNFVVATEYKYQIPQAAQTAVAGTASAQERFVTKEEADENQYTIIEIIYDQFTNEPIKATVKRPDGSIAVIEYTEQEAAELARETEQQKDNKEGTNSPVPAPTIAKTKVTVLANTRFNIIETPFFEKQITVYDKPPMFPQVTFLPYQGVDDQISVLLEANTGRVEEKMTILRDSDLELHQLMAENQNKEIDEKIKFGTDSLPVRFEASILDYLPYSYEDFKNSSFIRVPATGRTGFASFLIDANKQYYFCFRAIDEGGVSNPTEVFRVQMVSYANGIFLDMEAIEMRPPISLSAMAFQKRIKIRPAFRQRALAFPEAESEDSSPESLRDFYNTAPKLEDFDIGYAIERDPVTGEDKGKVWDKNFKLRLTSKTTGKKIDVNFQFKREKKLIEKPEDNTRPDLTMDEKIKSKTQIKIRKAPGEGEKGQLRQVSSPQYSSAREEQQAKQKNSMNTKEQQQKTDTKNNNNTTQKSKNTTTKYN